MTSASEFKQLAHKLLVIPGPVEVADEVLYQNAHPSNSHMAPDFAVVFQDAIKKTKQVIYADNSFVFLISGSGTLGWDQVGANLIERGDKALVITTGYFGDAFAECLEAFGAEVTLLTAPVGDRPSQEQIAEALSKDKYKLVTFTHVDTSTSVLVDPKTVAETVRKVSPDTLVVSDAVCAVASEEIRFDEWDLDIVISASQKGLGAPPGLSVLAASKRAIQAFENRKSPPSAYYSSWKKWMPIMKTYEQGVASYFATPPVNLIYAYHASLKIITEGPVSLEERLALHKSESERFRKELAKMGLKQLTVSPEVAANGLTVLYLPKGLQHQDLLPRMSAKGIILAPGLQKDTKSLTFRIGHMGITVVDKKRNDLDTILNALRASIEEALKEKSS